MPRLEGGLPAGGQGEDHFDAIVVGSGFGGSVAALRLTEKGHRVLVLEQGRRWRPEDFPRTNWNLRRWMWEPGLGMRGIFQMAFFEHVTVLRGIGVGGGSLVYAATLPTPPSSFFRADSWAHLADWEAELTPHYATARRMLGVTENPFRTRADEVLERIAERLGRREHFGPTQVGIYFGEPGRRVADPFFGGRGPERTGCTGCGACMTGCREGAKNSLDHNYLYLAEQQGAMVLSGHRVTAVRALQPAGFLVEARGEDGNRRRWSAERVFLAAGVLGTTELLLRMRHDPQGLPALSPRVGDGVRTNSEALIGVVTPRRDEDLSRGTAITSILHTDEHSHVEPVRYGSGSGFFRTFALPHAPGASLPARLAEAARRFGRQPGRWLRAMTVRDFARHSQVLLYMRTLEGTLSLRLGRSVRTGLREGLVTRVDDPAAAPAAFMEEATRIAEWFAEEVDGVVVSLLTETVLGVPSTAHILGGACMGASAEEGVIDADHRVHGYEGLYVVDGAAVSANPGVNPSLTITALAERALSKVPPRAASA